MGRFRRRRHLAGAALGLLASLLVAGSTLGHGTVPVDPPTVTSLLFGWDFEPAVILPLVGVVIWWWRMLAAIDRDHPHKRVPSGQRWAFLAGLAVIAFALQSGIGRYDTALFSIHMVQHLLLTLVAPPLLALGAPITQLLRASSSKTRRRWILPFLNSRVISVLSHPVLAWILFAGVMWGTHFSPIFNASLEDPLTHDLEHLAYLTAGLLFWWPVVGIDPSPHRMGYPARIGFVFLQMPQNSFLAMTILFAASPLYPHYATLGSPYGINALDDQRFAGAFMWIAGDVIFMLETMAILAGWMRSETRRNPRADREAALELAAIREREVALRLRRETETGDQPLSAASTRER